MSVFSIDIRATVITDDSGKIESIHLWGGQNLPRVAQQQIMTEAHTAWQKSMGKNGLAVIETTPFEKGEGWSKFRAWPHQRSYEIPKD